MDSKYAKVFAAFDTSVYDEYYDVVLDFFSQELGKRRTLQTIKNLQKTLWELIKLMNKDEDDPSFKYVPTKNYKKKINEIFNSCLKKFEKAGFISTVGLAIESVEPEFISKFIGGRSFFKKSVERGTRWLIYYYYMNRTKKTGKFSIPLSKLENGLQAFSKIKNYQGLVEKLVLSESNEYLDIFFHKKTKSISINRNPDGGNYGLAPDLLPLLSGLEFYNRAQAGQLEERITNLVEYQPFANKEIVNLTGADKGHVSKIMNRLNEDGIIIPVGNAGNFRYWLTNCDKCPFDKKKVDCFDETSTSISKFFNDKFGVSFNANDFAGVDNHILRNMNLKLQSESFRDYIATSNRNSPSDASYLDFYKFILNRVLDSMKDKNPMEKADAMLEHMPRLYVLGFFQALRESRKFEAGKVMELMEKVRISPGDIEKFNEEYIKHIDAVHYKEDI